MRTKHFFVYKYFAFPFWLLFLSHTFLLTLNKCDNSNDDVMNDTFFLYKISVIMKVRDEKDFVTGRYCKRPETDARYKF